jgi:hypothetical protein
MTTSRRQNTNSHSGTLLDDVSLSSFSESDQDQASENEIFEETAIVPKSREIALEVPMPPPWSGGNQKDEDKVNVFLSRTLAPS